MRAPAWPIAFGALLLLALAVRLPDLASKPLHHDESMNAWFTLGLYWWGHFRYQPSDYHGPLLYYVSWACFRALGPSEVSLRLGTALAGALLPLVALVARRWLSAAGALVAALLLAVAPGMVFFSRTAIHEIYLVLFTALWGLTLARFYDRPGRGRAIACAAAAAGCFVTKETAILTAGSLAAGVVLAWLAGPATTLAERARLRSTALAILRCTPLGLAVFAFLLVLFYSSFFTHAAGIAGFFEAYRPWIDYGTTGRNQAKPFGYFFSVMGATEGAYRWLAPGVALLAVRSRERVGLALTGWALAAFAVYSTLPYKTPWCVLEIDLPVFLLIGWGAGRALAAACDAGRHTPERVVAMAAFATLLAPAPLLLARSLDDIRERWDDPSRPYVYHQTVREFLPMVQDLLGVGDAMPGADGLGPRVVNVDAENPIRWYTLSRGWALERTRYRENPEPPFEWIEEAQIVMSSRRHIDRVRSMIEATGAAWHMEVYPLRPGVKTTVWYRRELWDRYQMAGGRAVSPWPRPPARRLPRPPPPESP